MTKKVLDKSPTMSMYVYSKEQLHQRGYDDGLDVGLDNSNKPRGQETSDGDLHINTNPAYKHAFYLPLP